MKRSGWYVLQAQLQAMVGNRVREHGDVTWAIFFNLNLRSFCQWPDRRVLPGGVKYHIKPVGRPRGRVIGNRKVDVGTIAQ